MMMMMHRIREKEDNDSMFAPNNNVESHWKCFEDCSIFGRISARLWYSRGCSLIRRSSALESPKPPQIGTNWGEKRSKTEVAGMLTCISTQLTGMASGYTEFPCHWPIIVPTHGCLSLLFSGIKRDRLTKPLLPHPPRQKRGHPSIGRDPPSSQWRCPQSPSH